MKSNQFKEMQEDKLKDSGRTKNPKYLGGYFHQLVMKGLRRITPIDAKRRKCRG